MSTGTLTEDPPSESTSTNLLRRVVAGDQEAWKRFAGIYSALIYTRCRRRGVSADESADVVQGVLHRVLRTIGEFRRDQPGQGFRRWLRTIARNVINDHFRGLLAQREGLGRQSLADVLGEVPAPQDEDSDVAEDVSDIRLMVRQTMQSIRIDYEDSTWQAFWRTAVDQQPAIEVAAELGLTHGSVRQATYKIKKRLRTELEGLGFVDPAESSSSDGESRHPTSDAI